MLCAFVTYYLLNTEILPYTKVSAKFPYNLILKMGLWEHGHTYQDERGDLI